MEVCIVKKLSMTVDIDVPDDVTAEELSAEIKKVIDSSDEYDWEDYEVYEAYDTYSGVDIDLDF